MQSDGQTGEVRLDGECEAVRACYMISHEDYINTNDIILDYQKIFFMKYNIVFFPQNQCGDILLLMLVSVGNCLVITTVSSYY